MEHRRFSEFVDYLRDGDVIVFNDSRVIPARLKGRRIGTGGRVEILLLRRLDAGLWEALVRPAKRLLPGAGVEITGGSSTADRAGEVIQAEITGVGEGGIRTISFSDEALLMEAGEVPLPPYIHVPLDNPERYQQMIKDCEFFNKLLNAPIP